MRAVVILTGGLAIAVLMGFIRVADRRHVRLRYCTAAADLFAEPLDCLGERVHERLCATITGAGFGAPAAFGGSEEFLNKAWNDFERSLTAGGWQPDGFNPKP